jgi:hypothetical protein
MKKQSKVIGFRVREEDEQEAKQVVKQFLKSKNYKQYEKRKTTTKEKRTS